LDEVVFNTEAHPLPMFDVPPHFHKADWRKVKEEAAAAAGQEVKKAA
jgi:hypothetical protein